MGKQYKKLTNADTEFIKKQRLFYIASSSSHELNLSPKGYDSIHLLDATTLLFLDYPGSGNRTARDIKEGGDITLVFNAFEGKAKILRLFCKGELIEKEDEIFSQYLNYFNAKIASVRRIIKIEINAVESSCGMSIPYMEYKGERNSLKNWVKNMSESGSLKRYIQEHEIPPNLKEIK